MHDILGGSNPTTRPVTGLLSSICSFCHPIGFNTPQGGIPIPNANGAIPTVNVVIGIPLGIGLAGITFAPNNNNNNQSNAQLHLGPDGLGLGFGTITVIDDVLTSQIELGQMMAFTMLFKEGKYGGTEKFKNAKGFAELRLLFPTGQVSIDGAETLLKITVHLSY
ncbi:hypothetical protein GYH30_027820 [Glycine max]|uniref:Dirigent protein n=1 Tax=Glycine max TaxID=3847 RepID=A0A0R0HSR5_SOYBN|nr:hypothetical protein GYH30_027820 [Glycine max]